MRSVRPHLDLFLRNGLAIALGCSVIVGTGWAVYAKSDAAGAVGGLSIATEPANASVYVDGRPAGTSPVTLPAISAGEHRVRIVKSGYLENARIVTVEAGQPKAVQVRLTRTADTSNAGQVVSGGGGGGSKKWLYFAAAGGAAAAAGILLANRNHAPSAGTATVSPTGTGIAAVTNFSFASQGATDPDGDSLTFTWSFGDGTTVTGGSVNHVFPSAGTFNVGVTVSDGKAEVKSPDVPVTVRSVAAAWVSNRSGVLRTWTFTQSGTSATGSYTRSEAGVNTPGTVSAMMTSPRSISGTATSTAFAPFSFEGSFDSNVAILTVVANGSGFTGDTLTFARQ